MGAYELQQTPVPSVLYVDDSADGANDGTSWQNAFTDLQDALAVAAGAEVEEIRVAQGVYRPAGPGGSREASFQLISDVTVRGGYAGVTGADSNARNVSAYETILSGDLNGDDDLDFGGNGENSYHVVRGGGTSAVLDGLTIAYGNADGTLFYPESRGGGMYGFGGTAIDCVIRNNVAIDGGGLNQPSGQFVQCVIADNTAVREVAAQASTACIPRSPVAFSAATSRSPTAATAAAAASIPWTTPRI